MPAYKLYYFPFRAVSEVIRQIFAYAGVEYTDERVDDKQWENLKDTTPFGQMPVLEVDGKPIPQSYAIARHLASQHGLTGADAWESAWVDAIADQYKDYLGEFRNFWYVQMEIWEGDLEALKAEFGPSARDKFFPIIVKQLKESGSGFLVGKGVTWVDFMIADHVAAIEAELPGFLDAYPEVTAHSKKIRAIPSIAAWIEMRPVTRG